MGHKVKRTTFTLRPAGEYPAILVAVDTDDLEFGPVLKLFYDLTGPKGELFEQTELCSQTFSERSKLFARYKALMGVDSVPSDVDFDSDDILGRHCMVVLTTRADPSGIRWNKIDSVLPAGPYTPPLGVDADVEGEEVPF